MQQTAEDRADAWFHALSDRTRRDILARVLVGEHSVSALARDYDMSLTAVQKHVLVLERAGLLSRRRRGRETLARGDAHTLRSASQLLTELEALQREQIGRIDALLEAEHRAGDTPAPTAQERPCPSPTSATTSTASP